MTTNGEGGTPTPPGAEDDLVISIRAVRAQPTDDPGALAVEIETTRGVLTGILHPREGRSGCAIMISGAGSGMDGPADGVYARLGPELVKQGVTTLRIQWREPGEFTECVLDTLAACSFLKGLGGDRAVIVGHSFGGAVAIKAASLAPLVQAVVAMSSQRFGTAEVNVLNKPLLLIHGSADDVLLPAASEDIFGRAAEPKRLVVLEGAGHALSEAADDVYQMLERYIVSAVGDEPS